MNSTPRLLTVAQFAERHPAFSEGSLRWLRFKQEEMGFQRAFLSCGRRVLIDEDQFFEVIAKQNRSSDPECGTGNRDSRPPTPELRRAIT